MLVERPEEPLMSLKDLAMDAFYHPERGGQLSAESSIKHHEPTGVWLYLC
ncbi:hypothetical protein ACLBOM_09535 [Escherichia coli]